MRRQEKSQQKRILSAIYRLPREGDIKKMSGNKDLYRLRLGDCRILFLLTPKGFDVILVDVTDADSKGQIYKN